MADVRDVLLDLGYKIQDHGREFRMTPLYRDSNNSSVLRVYKDTGWWTDFKENKAGPFEELVRLTLGLSNIEEARAVIVNKYKFERSPRKTSKIEHVKALPKEMLLHLVTDSTYWNNRGISSDTLSVFEGGVRTEGPFKDRYIFPIFNSSKTLIGVTGRDVTGKSPLKWKHLGPKSVWRYPLQINYNIVKDTGQIILIESIGDMLALWEAGIKNTIVMFGLHASRQLLSTIVSLDPDEIIIALNNDGYKGAGNDAAIKLSQTLNKHFDEGVVRIKLPCKNDFGCMNKKEILEWQKS